MFIGSFHSINISYYLNVGGHKIITDLVRKTQMEMMMTGWGEVEIHGLLHPEHPLQPQCMHSTILPWNNTQYNYTVCVYTCIHDSLCLQVYVKATGVCVCVLYIKSGTMGIWLQVQLKPWTNQLNYPWQLVHHLITGSANIYISNELQPKWNIFFHKNWFKNASDKHNCNKWF